MNSVIIMMLKFILLSINMSVNYDEYTKHVVNNLNKFISIYLFDCLMTLMIFNKLFLYYYLLNKFYI